MSNALAWLYLTIAIITEVAGITSMKLSHGFAQLIPSIFIFIFYAVSMTFLALSLKRLEVGFAYAIWSAVGTLLIFFIGALFFHETVTAFKTVSLFFIIMGVMGLKQS
jgi:small multidrug resistance pump